MKMTNLHSERSLNRYLLLLCLPAILFIFSCSSAPENKTEAETGTTGETFAFDRKGLFGDDYDFGEFKIRKLDVSRQEKSSIGIKESELESLSKALGFSLEDPAGYKWNIVTLSVLEKSRNEETERGEYNIARYAYEARLVEENTGMKIFIRTEYVPGAEDFDSSLKGNVLNETGDVVFTVSSNGGLDTHEKPDDGLQTFTILKGEETLVSVDSGKDFSVIFHTDIMEQTEKTQLAAVASSFFTLMKMGVQ